MTLIEFLAAVKRRTQADNVLGTLYWLKHYGGKPRASVAELKSAMVQARVTNARTLNVNAVINRAGASAHQAGRNGRGVYVFELTGTGEAWVRERFGIAEPEPEDTDGVENDVAALEKLLESISDEVTRGYIEEAILCLKVGALRAAVVFLWTGAVRTLQDRALGHGKRALNDALKKHDQRARDVGKIEDFAWVKDSILLLACGELSMLDKGERTTLEEALNLRNRCGHPTRYRPGVARARSFIEDVVGTVWRS